MIATLISIIIITSLETIGGKVKAMFEAIRFG
jgi:Flp pilus assembly pilin Flp